VKKLQLFVIGMIPGIILLVGTLWIGSTGNVLVEPGHAALLASATVTASLSDEGAAIRTPQLAAGDDELPPANLNMELQAPATLPTPIPGETLVYFMTTDNDATATVVNLLNTDSVVHIVALRGYSYNGVLAYSLNISVAAGSLLRLTSDSVAASPPPSWATPAPIITNFTDFTYYASLSLPKGVKAEGYTLYNPGTGTVDPRLDQGAIPLRFSTDPATLFLPTVMNNP
jgi:hypothetical protein